MGIPGVPQRWICQSYLREIYEQSCAQTSNCTSKHQILEGSLLQVWDGSPCQGTGDWSFRAHSLPDLFSRRSRKAVDQDDRLFHTEDRQCQSCRRDGKGPHPDYTRHWASGWSLCFEWCHNPFVVKLCDGRLRCRHEQRLCKRCRQSREEVGWNEDIYLGKVPAFQYVKCPTIE